MTLPQLLEGVQTLTDIPNLETTGPVYDSRKVQPGNLFFAFPGSKTDGAQFADQAVTQGAVAVASETQAPENFSVPWIQLQHGRKALAIAAGNFYNHPDRRLKLIGITGTNGKTTTTWLLDAILNHANLKTALIGTIEYRMAGRTIPSINTTPESLDLFELFHQLESKQGTHVIMETSSHALALGRVHNIEFDSAVFTNFTRDHLDFHGTMEAYFAAKQILFNSETVQGPKHAILNFDDKQAQSIQLKPTTEAVWYGLEKGADAHAVRIANSFKGLRFDIQFRGERHSIESPLVGQINVYNILAAWCAAFAQGIEPALIADGIRQCPAVPGRFERVEAGQPYLVIVDYAHTDDALRNTIATARGLKPTRVITLFGCGGDRDRSKRPLMGMAAAEASDYVVLTSDNPRSEDPLAIMNDALVGLRRFDTPLAIEPDRERAIRKALTEAHAGDLVIIAGKGHETYQVLKDKTIAFDDREIAREILRGFGYGGNR